MVGLFHLTHVTNGLEIVVENSSQHSVKPKTPNTARTGQVRAFAHTFGSLAPTADLASGGCVRQIHRCRYPVMSVRDLRLPLGRSKSTHMKANSDD
jgi:hypothetical protein